MASNLFSVITSAEGLVHSIGGRRLPFVPEGNCVIASSIDLFSRRFSLRCLNLQYFITAGLTRALCRKRNFPIHLDLFFQLCS